MNYVHIPMRGSAENSLRPETTRSIRRGHRISRREGVAALHGRLAGEPIWAAYLIRDRGVPVATALVQTRSINLRDETPFGGQQPIEGFLGRSIAELARPKQ